MIKIDVSKIPVDNKTYKCSYKLKNDDMFNFFVIRTRDKEDDDNVKSSFYIRQKQSKKLFQVSRFELVEYIETLNFRKNVLELICKSCPFFSTLVNDIDNDIVFTRINGMFLFGFLESANANKLIKGHMQSGKTWLIISICLYYYLVYRISSIILIQNSIDAMKQFFDRLENTRKKYEKKLKTLETRVALINFDRGRNTIEKEISNAVTTNRSYIFVSLRSESDIEPLILAIEKTQSKRIVSIFDESDFVDSGAKNISQESLIKLKLATNVIWNVTATPISSLMKEEIGVANVYLMPKPKHYKSISEIHFQSVIGNFCSLRDHDPFLLIPSLQNYIDTFSKSKIYSYGSQYHPVISLVRVTGIVETILWLGNYIKAKHKDITVITYNGGNHGIGLYHSSLNEKIKIEDAKKYEFKNGIHTFLDCHISKIFDFLQERGIENHKHIMIIAGKKADRGITFTSTYDKMISKKQIPWHLTEMFLMVSQSSNQASILQVVGRLCGIYYDTIPLTVYSNVNEDIIKAYHAQEELLERSLENEQKDIAIKEVIIRIPISREKCSKRRFTNPKVSCKISKVDDDSIYGGWDWEAEDRKIELEEADFENRKSFLKKSKAREEIEQIRKGIQNDIPVSKEKLQIKLDSKESKFIYEKDLGEVGKELFSYLYDELENQDKDDWFMASKFYREGKKDRQNLWHFYEKAKSEFTLKERSIGITKENDHFYIRLS